MKKLILLAILLTSIAASAAQRPVRDVTGWNHFAWGAEVGGSIDMTSNDMSSVNLDAYFGYRNSWIDVIGIGAGIDMMVNNSVRSFPVYGIFRTGFSRRPTLLFLDLRGGVAINNLSEGDGQTCAYVAPGIGVNLAGGKTFQSYVTVSYVYNALRPFDIGDRHVNVDGLSMACIRLGITF